jgi:hypothetical protein
MVSLSLQKEPLKGTIELADGLLFIDTLVALEALNEGFTGGRDRLSECRFPAPRRPFDDNRLLHPGGEIDDLELTGSITYLAAFSRAPNSSIDENTAFLWVDSRSGNCGVPFFPNRTARARNRADPHLQGNRRAQKISVKLFRTWCG